MFGPTLNAVLRVVADERTSILLDKHREMPQSVEWL